MPAEGKVIAIPEGIDFDTAATSLDGAHDARNFVNKVGPQAGAPVLVYGAAGAIGSAAIRILLDLGVEVVAVCGPDLLDVVAELARTRGPIPRLDYQRAPLEQQLRGARCRFAFDDFLCGRCRAGPGRGVRTQRGPAGALSRGSPG